MDENELDYLRFFYRHAVEHLTADNLRYINASYLIKTGNQPSDVHEDTPSRAYWGQGYAVRHRDQLPFWALR